MLIPLFAALLVGRPALEEPSDLSGYPWLYLRDGEPLAPDEKAVDMVAVGDVMLGRAVAEEPDFFAAVASTLRAADLTVGNLECVIADDWGTPDALRAPPATVSRLRRAGFDVLGLANNHALDLGASGLAETVSRLQAAEIATVGAGADPGTARQAVIREVDGVHLAFLAFNAVPDGRESQDEGWTLADWDSGQAAAAVGAARDRADAVIVSVHWGYEYQTRVDPAQRDAAKVLFQAGADLVIGHHPHVVQAFETHNGRCVAYSLGNFVFDQGWGDTRQGLALRAFFDGQGLRAVQALPVQAGARPRLMAVEAAGSLLERVQPPPPRMGFACEGEACRSVEPSRETSRGREEGGLFWGGKIDLTGDGVLESVRRVNEQVIIYSDGTEAWRSPPTWRVVDVALGDPNDDGRGEVLLALWKPGLDGLETPSPEKLRVPRSHPFIVGYRGGIYRTLWGGSAVSDPIHEVELGDVNGDGDQELIVLDGDGPDERTVSVWRWHGWGFSLMWRSDPGAYRELSLSGDGIISVGLE
jgi:poly-gamma-glutamate synthesis protein (capsule biosynthesis protein)